MSCSKIPVRSILQLVRALRCAVGESWIELLGCLYPRAALGLVASDVSNLPVVSGDFHLNDLLYLSKVSRELSIADQRR